MKKGLYSKIFEKCIRGNELSSCMERIGKIARMLKQEEPDCSDQNSDYAMWAFAVHEDMTGLYFDPTQDDLDEIISCLS